MEETSPRIKKLRRTLVIIILATLPLYLLGSIILWVGTAARNSRTPTPIISTIIVTATTEPTFTLAPPTAYPTPTATNTATITPTYTITLTPTATLTPTNSPTVTETKTETPTEVPTVTPIALPTESTPGN